MVTGSVQHQVMTSHPLLKLFCSELQLGAGYVKCSERPEARGRRIMHSCVRCYTADDGAENQLRCQQSLPNNSLVLWSPIIGDAKGFSSLLSALSRQVSTIAAPHLVLTLCLLLTLTSAAPLPRSKAYDPSRLLHGVLSLILRHAMGQSEDILKPNNGNSSPTKHNGGARKHRHRIVNVFIAARAAHARHCTYYYSYDLVKLIEAKEPTYWSYWSSYSGEVQKDFI
ncbi:hypothetical protein HW555_006172 [Spodoptera exigua]|uniref:Uncharacterized protein n=1 Tax=Spodoptera exigua TaxID=7107 RepID=A0A835GFL8_SPOEX|nr:hypothetical protein HW555_006172 [Spodoptera exigua]